MKKLILLLIIVFVLTLFMPALADENQCKECCKGQFGEKSSGTCEGYCSVATTGKPKTSDVETCQKKCKTGFPTDSAKIIKCQSCCPNLLYGFTSPIFSQTQIFSLIVEFTRWFATIVFAIAVIMIIYGAVLYITAAGSEEKAKTARKLLLYACIGIAVAILAFGAQFLVQSFLTPPAATP